MNAVPVFPIDEFLETFDEFSSVDIKVVQSCGKRAMHYIKFGKIGMPIPSDEDGDRKYALMLMAGHILKLKLDALNGGDDSGSGGSSQSGTVGRVKKAIVGTVTVETDSPNTYTSTDFTYWLSQTPYGSELLALLEACSPIGVYLNCKPDSVRVLT